VVGAPVRIPFQVSRGRQAVAQVSTRSGIVLTRHFLLRDHTGVLEWTPDAPGLAVVRLRATGRQGQTVSTSIRLRVHRHPATVSPSVTLLRVPEDLTVGVPTSFALQADGCRVAVVQIEGPVADVPTSRFPCPVPLGTFTWTPHAPGDYVLTAEARGAGGLTASQRLRLVVAAAPSSGPASSPSARPSTGVRRTEAP